MGRVRNRCRAALLILLPAALTACGQSASLPSPSIASAATETAAIGPRSREALPPELKIAASGQPTDLYMQVARGALGCWFGADGPLKRTHVFTAEAAPPAKGGHAEIILQERDPAQPEQRGARAFQVAFGVAPGGTEIAVASQKLAPEVAQAMKRDVETWARGQSGCELRTVLAPAPTPALPSTGKLLSAKVKSLR